MGKPAKPIQLLILKQLCSLSNENIIEQWSETLYFQNSALGSEEIFKESIYVNHDDILTVETIRCIPTELVSLCGRITSLP